MEADAHPPRASSRRLVFAALVSAMGILGCFFLVIAPWLVLVWMPSVGVWREMLICAGLLLIAWTCLDTIRLSIVWLRNQESAPPWFVNSHRFVPGLVTGAIVTLIGAVIVAWLWW